MKEEIVTFELAKKLKEAGFNGECREYYVCFPDSFPNPNDVRQWCVEMPCDHNSDSQQRFAQKAQLYSAPTLALAVKWLLEVKKICVEARVSNEPNEYLNDMDAVYFPTIIILSGCEISGGFWNENLYKADPKWFDSSEKALSHGISYALTLLQKK